MAQKIILGGVCPICKKADATHAHRPFCSKTCREIDLMRWLNGDYAVPAAEAPDDFGAEDFGEEAKTDDIQ